MAKAALEMAVLDAELRASGRSFARELGATRDRVPCGVSVGIMDSIPVLLDAVGGSAVLIDLQSNTPAIGNAAHYAKIVEEHALLRRLIGVKAAADDAAWKARARRQRYVSYLMAGLIGSIGFLMSTKPTLW